MRLALLAVFGLQRRGSQKKINLQCCFEKLTDDAFSGFHRDEFQDIPETEIESNWDQVVDKLSGRSDIWESCADDKQL